MFGQDQDNSQYTGQVADNQGDGTAPPVTQPTVSAHAGSYDGVNAPTDSPAPAASVVTPTADPAAATTSAEPVSEDLLEIKQQALHQLMPVIDKLDQTPEEKFRTTMMVIQASDNRDLIRTAYEAATQIADEKERALALVSVVNEINYFSQHDSKQQPGA